MLAAPGPLVPRSGRSEPLQASRYGKRFSRQRFCFHPGHANRQVTQALFLSPRTVEANLARVYRKLGVSSRAGLGAVMARSGATPPAS